jgi:hypothetical protein
MYSFGFESHSKYRSDIACVMRVNLGYLSILIPGKLDANLDASSNLVVATNKKT